MITKIWWPWQIFGCCEKKQSGDPGRENTISKTHIPVGWPRWGAHREQQGLKGKHEGRDSREQRVDLGNWGQETQRKSKKENDWWKTCSCKNCIKTYDWEKEVPKQGSFIISDGNRQIMKNRSGQRRQVSSEEAVTRLLAPQEKQWKSQTTSCRFKTWKEITAGLECYTQWEYPLKVL